MRQVQSRAAWRVGSGRTIISCDRFVDDERWIARTPFVAYTFDHLTTVGVSVKRAFAVNAGREFDHELLSTCAVFTLRVWSLRVQWCLALVQTSAELQTTRAFKQAYLQTTAEGSTAYLVPGDWTRDPIYFDVRRALCETERMGCIATKRLLDLSDKRSN